MVDLLAKKVIKTDSYDRSRPEYASTYRETFRGLPVHAQEGLHAMVAELLKANAPPGGSILDLGAGAGALSCRLLEMEFRITAVDYQSDNFCLQQVPFLQFDLNQDFALALPERFDGIVAVELIEHLENPRHFLRQCHELLAPGGSLVLTTPNIDNPVSRGVFLRSGQYQWFTDYNYEKDGHITPISQWLLRRMIAEAGFRTVWLGSHGDPFQILRNPVTRVLAHLLRMVSSLPKDLTGEILVAVVRKDGEP